MRDGIQTNFKHAAIRSAGCYFLALLKIAEYWRIWEKADYEGFTDDQIIAIYETCVAKGLMKPNCYINDAILVLNHALFAAGASRKCFNMLRSTEEPSEGPYIRHIKKKTTEHYFVGNLGKFIQWDSWAEADQITQGYETISFRLPLAK